MTESVPTEQFWAGYGTGYRDAVVQIKQMLEDEHDLTQRRLNKLIEDN